MSYKIILTPNAIQNLNEAIQYYKNNVSDSVAHKFLLDYKNTYKSIKKTIFFRIFFDNFRAKPFKKFPYIIFYLLDEKNKIITISAVFHTAQNPNKDPKS